MRFNFWCGVWFVILAVILFVTGDVCLAVGLFIFAILFFKIQIVQEDVVNRDYKDFFRKR